MKKLDIASIVSGLMAVLIAVAAAMVLILYVLNSPYVELRSESGDIISPIFAVFVVSVAAIILCVIYLGTVLIRQKKNSAERENELRETTAQQKVEIEALQGQLDLARTKISTSQMQPHFLYNALASIREIILDDPEYASDLVCDFTTHLRACVRSMSGDMFVPFPQELENIKAYVNIEKMRFGDRMDVQYDIEEDDFDVLPLSIQPIVENAIRHGIYPLTRTGHVLVSAKREDDAFVIRVKDDGVGFDVDAVRAEVEEGKRDSTGLQNLIFRLEKLMQANVDIRSRIGEGTEVTVTIPVSAAAEKTGTEVTE